MAEQFRFITAEDWNATWERPPVYEALEDPECYIHHTAGNPMSNMHAEQAMQALNQYAQDKKNYSFLDYDYMVHWYQPTDLYTIAEGRGKWLSAATSNRNELGEAICLFGYFHTGHPLTASPRPGHIKATALGILKMIERKLLSRECKILGHYQNLAYSTPQTGCPGNLFIPHIPEVIELVRQGLNQNNSGDDMGLPDPKLPRRLLDTRTASPASAGQTMVFNVPGLEGASSAQITVTTMNSDPGHLTAWGSGTRPDTSFLNMEPGKTITETLFIPLDSSNNFRIWTFAKTDLVVDFTGVYG